MRLGGLEKPSGFSEKPISAAAPERAASLPRGTGSRLSCRPPHLLCLPPTAAGCPLPLSGLPEQLQARGTPVLLVVNAVSLLPRSAPHCPSPPTASFPVASPPLHTEGTSMPSLPLAPPHPHVIWSRHPKRLCFFYLLFMASRRNGRIQLWAIPVLLPNPDRSSVFLLK